MTLEEACKIVSERSQALLDEEARTLKEKFTGEDFEVARIMIELIGETLYGLSALRKPRILLYCMELATNNLQENMKNVEEVQAQLTGDPDVTSKIAEINAALNSSSEVQPPDGGLA